MGGGVSKSGSSSQSSNNIDQNQLPYLQNLWAGGQGLQNQQQGSGFDQAMFSNAEQLYGQGNQFMNTLQNAGQQQPYTPSAAYDSQMAAGQQAIGQAGDRAMHSAGQTGIQAGQFGQGRGEVARGLVGEGMTNAAGQLSGQLMGQDMQNQTALQGIGAQSAMGGLNSLNSQFQLGMSPYAAQWMPAQMQAGLVGGPVTVGDSSSKSKSMSVSGGKG